MWCINGLNQNCLKCCQQVTTCSQRVWEKMKKRENPNMWHSAGTKRYDKCMQWKSGSKVTKWDEKQRLRTSAHQSAQGSWHKHLQGAGSDTQALGSLDWWFCDCLLSCTSCIPWLGVCHCSSAQNLTLETGNGEADSPGAEWRRARCSSDSSLIQCTQALLWGTLSQTHHPPPLAGEVMCGWHTHSVWWMCWVGTRVWPGSKDSQEGVEWMSSLRNPIQNCSKNSRKQTCNKPQLFIFDGITQSKALEAGNFGMSRLPKFLSEHAKASHIDRAAAVDATPKKCHGRRSDDFRQKRLSSTLHLSSVREFLCSL